MARTTGTASLVDLLRAGVLLPGEPIEVRRRSAPSVEATVNADGQIAYAGALYSTPTGAAKDALDVGSVDGWLRWRVPRLGGKTLADLRMEVSA